jgi:predicted Zn-dependent peptidase
MEKLKFYQKSPALLIHEKKTDQTHMVLGFHGYPANHKDSAVLEVMAGVLGKGMSSRLFQKLREEMGACYYVRVSNGQYAEHGDFTISTGVDKKRVEEVMKVIIEECNRLKREEVGGKELQKTKDYIVGNLYMGLETTDALANFVASDEIILGKAKSVKELEKEIRSVTARDIKRVAQKIFVNPSLNLAIVGQVSDPKKVKAALKL